MLQGLQQSSWRITAILTPHLDLVSCSRGGIPEWTNAIFPGSWESFQQDQTFLFDAI